MFYFIFILNSCYGVCLVNKSRNLEVILNYYQATNLEDVVSNLNNSEEAMIFLDLMIKEDMKNVFSVVVLKRISELLQVEQILSIIEKNEINFSKEFCALYNEIILEENSFAKVSNMLSFFIKLYLNGDNEMILKQFFKINSSDILKKYLEVDWDNKNFSDDLNFVDVIGLFIFISNFLNDDSFIFQFEFSIFEKQQLLTLIRSSKFFIAKDDLGEYSKGMKDFILKFIKSLDSEVDKLVFAKSLNEIFTLEDLCNAIYNVDEKFKSLLKDIGYFRNMVGYIKCTVRDIDEQFTDEERELLLFLGKVSNFDDLNLLFLENGHLIHQELLIKDKIAEATDFMFFVCLGWDQEDKINKLLIMRDFFHKLPEDLIFQDEYFSKVLEYSIAKNYLLLTKSLLAKADVEK